MARYQGAHGLGKKDPRLVPLEKDISKAIKERLMLAGWFPSIIKERYFVSGGGQLSEPGIPDIVAIKGGRVVMFEVKRPLSYSKPNKKQTLWHQEWKAHGGEVFVVRSVEEVEAIIG